MNKFFLSLALAVTIAVCMVTGSSLSEEPLQQYGMLQNFGKFIDHFGHDAITFLGCMGPLFVTHCSGTVIQCLTAHDIMTCIQAIKCEGHDAAKCAVHLHEAHEKKKAEEKAKKEAEEQKKQHEQPAQPEQPTQPQQPAKTN